MDENKYKRCLKGRIISVDGPDFSGKTTIVKKIKEYLEDKSVIVDLFRQPGATKFGNECRDLLFNKGYNHLDLMTERMLFTMDHSEFNAKLINRDCEHLTLTDRWSPVSNFVYGYFGDGIHPSKIYKINEISTLTQKTIIKPDLLILFDVSEENLITRMEKAQSENREINRLDIRDFNFKNRIRNGYQKVDVFFPEYRIIHISTDDTEDNVFKNTVKLIEKIFI